MADGLEKLLRHAISDPGSFTPRGDNYEEPIPHWEARAAIVALRQQVRYLMISPDGERHWLTERDCASALNGPWRDGGMALDLDTFVERRLTEDEKNRITSLSHDLSAMK